MSNCQRCGFKKWLKTEKVNENGVRYWKCGRCGEIAIGDYPFKRSSPKELYLDIETSLTELRGNFGTKVHGEYINPKMIGRPYFIICWSALWTDKPSKVFSACVTQEDALAYTDKNILAPLWDLMDKADTIAGHNVVSFDAKKINTRFLINGFAEPLGYKTIDTLKLARKKYNFESNSLDYLFRLFGIKRKDKMTIDDWLDIKETGDPKALRKMLRYNKGDVKGGSEILQILRGEMPANFGMRSFPKEPLDTREEGHDFVREMQDSLDNIEHKLEEETRI